MQMIVVVFEYYLSDLFPLPDYYHICLMEFILKSTLVMLLF